MKSHYWAVPQGVQGFQSSRAYGILNAAGTHALALNGSPIVYDRKSIAAQVAPHADGLSQQTAHYWIPVFNSKAAAFASKG